DIEFKWKEIEKYNKLRTIEEAAQRKKRQKFSEEQKKIKRHKLKTTPLTFSDLEELDKEDKLEAKRKLTTKSEAGRVEVEGEKVINEQEEKISSNQDPIDEEEKEIKLKKRTIAGLLAGAMFYNFFKNKGQVVLDNTPEFLNFCKNSNGLVFWGPYGSGKTALMALLAHELPEENKYASFPCNLPWMERAQVDFAQQPTQPLGVKEVIFLDEINLLFRGNEFQKAQQMQRFLSHFFALSRHQGTKIFINGQRLGQVWIELREVATAVCNVSLLQKTDE
ncbi:34797_t:CDS:2, partial [Gigaspora margarita]